MCLAEALLRIPDADTADALIRDKIGRGDWRSHAGLSESLFVNAACWGLVVTGKLVASPPDANVLARALTDSLGRIGEPVIRAAMRAAMRFLGEQFVLGETIDAAIERAKACEARGYPLFVRHARRSGADGARTRSATTRRTRRRCTRSAARRERRGVVAGPGCPSSCPRCIRAIRARSAIA